MSLANYYKKIDLSSYFSKNKKYLYDYGYDKIFESGDGQYISIEGNEEAIALIERAQVSQDAVELKNYEIFESD